MEVELARGGERDAASGGDESKVLDRAEAVSDDEEREEGGEEALACLHRMREGHGHKLEREVGAKEAAALQQAERPHNAQQRQDPVEAAAPIAFTLAHGASSVVYASSAPPT